MSTNNDTATVTRGNNNKIDSSVNSNTNNSGNSNSSSSSINNKSNIINVTTVKTQAQSNSTTIAPPLTITLSETANRQMESFHNEDIQRSNAGDNGTISTTPAVTAATGTIEDNVPVSMILAPSMVLLDNENNIDQNHLKTPVEICRWPCHLHRNGTCSITNVLGIQYHIVPIRGILSRSSTSGGGGGTGISGNAGGSSSGIGGGSSGGSSGGGGGKSANGHAKSGEGNFITTYAQQIYQRIPQGLKRPIYATALTTNEFWEEIGKSSSPMMCPIDRCSQRYDRQFIEKVFRTIFRDYLFAREEYYIRERTAFDMIHYHILTDGNGNVALCNKHLIARHNTVDLERAEIFDKTELQNIITNQLSVDYNSEILKNFNSYRRVNQYVLDSWEKQVLKELYPRGSSKVPNTIRAWVDSINQKKPKQYKLQIHQQRQQLQQPNVTIPLQNSNISQWQHLTALTAPEYYNNIHLPHLLLPPPPSAQQQQQQNTQFQQLQEDRELQLSQQQKYHHQQQQQQQQQQQALYQRPLRPLALHTSTPFSNAYPSSTISSSSASSSSSPSLKVDTPSRNNKRPRMMMLPPPSATAVSASSSSLSSVSLISNAAVNLSQTTPISFDFNLQSQMLRAVQQPSRSETPSLHQSVSILKTSSYLPQTQLQPSLGSSPSSIIPSVMSMKSDVFSNSKTAAKSTILPSLLSSSQTITSQKQLHQQQQQQKQQQPAHQSSIAQFHNNQEVKIKHVLPPSLVAAAKTASAILLEASNEILQKPRISVFQQQQRQQQQQHRQWQHQYQQPYPILMSRNLRSNSIVSHNSSITSKDKQPKQNIEMQQVVKPLFFHR